jgi:hypothetical protein
MTKLKAYSVTEHDENRGEIYFAKHAIVARRLGADQYGDSELSNVSCRRVPWADKFAAQGDIPIYDLINNGWHFECHGCGGQMDSDWFYDNNLKLEGAVGSMRTPTFCCAQCQIEDEHRNALLKDQRTEAIEMMKGVLLRRFPTAEVIEKDTHAYVTGDHPSFVWEQVIIRFKYPGMKYGPAELRLDRKYGKPGPHRPEFTCCGGDVEAFNAWAEANPKPNRMEHHS